MARTKTYIISILLVSVVAPIGILKAQETTAVTQLDEVEITESRLSDFAIGAKTTRIDSSSLGFYTSASLAELLNDYTTSHIKAYGNGMLASISFRGTGPEHTAVLWHGINIAYPMLGQTDFSLIPLALTDQLIIQHGTGSSLYGSGSLGGTIAVGTSRPAPGLRFEVGQTFGSFETLGNNARFAIANERLYVKLLASWERSANNFTFQNTTKLGLPTETQQNAAFNQMGFGIESGLSLGGNSALEFSAQYVDMDRQLQPSMNVAESNDFQDDNNLRLRARYSYNGGKSNWYLQYAYLSDQINYNNSITRSNQQVVKGSLEQRLTKKLKVSLAADHSLVGVDAEFYTGQQVSETRSNIWGSLLVLPTSWLTISANIRQGFHPIYKVPVNPSLGAELNWLESSHARHQFSVLAARGFRIPTLNELYWNPGGNLDLKPEDSYSLEAGLKGEINDRHNFTYELTGYRMWVTNWILWRPTGNFWSPENIREVDAYGVEVASSFNHWVGQAQLTYRGNYGFTRSINQTGFDQFDRSVGKQLSYTPIHKGNLSTTMGIKDWLFSMNGLAVGKRFTTSDNENHLPAYFLLNIMASKNVNLGKYLLNFNAAVNNLLNTSYQSVENRAMPGINYLIGINLSYKQNNK